MAWPFRRVFDLQAVGRRRKGKARAGLHAWHGMAWQMRGGHQVRSGVWSACGLVAAAGPPDRRSVPCECWSGTRTGSERERGMRSRGT